MSQEIRFIYGKDAGFPPLLREIPDPPDGIYIRGALPVQKLYLSIVGTRRATPEGLHIARQFGKDIALAGFVVVSGLAFGIDAAAHEGALEAGVEASAIAVLANGLDSVYPESNARLAEKILARGGALVSEYPPGDPPYQSRFLERNRIVSGISKGTVIIEAPARSGSLVTARLALAQNRDVFVVPGPALHPNFKGSHALIRQGAELVTCVEEIFQSYRIVFERARAIPALGATPEETLILKALEANRAPLDVDKIIEMTKLEPRIANRTLSFLLMRDLIKETEAGYTI